MALSSSPDNFEIQYLVGVVKITIPGQKNSKQMLLLGAWLIYWLFIFAIILIMGWFVVSAFQSGESNFFLIILSAAIFFATLTWGMRGLAAAYVLFWQIAGVDTIEISDTIVRIRKKILGVSRIKVYERDKITSIKLGGPIIVPFAFTKFKFTSFDVAVTGRIIVTSKAKKREYLGLGLEFNQAEKVVAVIEKYLFPNHA